jgi:hypothetical protein
LTVDDIYLGLAKLTLLPVIYSSMTFYFFFFNEYDELLDLLGELEADFYG